MDAYYAEKKEDVLPIVKSLLKNGETITSGGSVTLKECGVLDFCEKRRLQFFSTVTKTV
ncbi:MAG: lactate utilization protein [Clostridiales bacterium]|nr:MAG: lactate utilization protein [Clostridiales bacterium]